MDKKSLPFLLTVLGIVLFVLVISLRIWTHYQEIASRAMAPGKPEVLGRSEGLVALAWVDVGEVESDGVLRLWVLLENRTDSEVRNLHFLVVHTPGFEKAGSCWSSTEPSGAPRCRPERRVGLPPVLEKGKSVTLFASLRPKVWYGYHGASGVIAWQDSQGKNWERAFTLPAVPVSSFWGKVFSALGRSLDLLKDLALPLVLVILGWYLQRRDKEREREREDREKERDAQREERDRAHAMLQETWRLMLPTLHSYAQKHYVPVVSSISGFLASASDKEAGDEATAEENHRQALFELLRLVSRMRHLAQAVGGLYLQDLDGEALAGHCWEPFLKRARDVWTRENLERAMLAISPDEVYAQFKEKLREPSLQKTRTSEELSKLLKTLDDGFRVWRKEKSFQQDRALLILFRCILTYETNRPYEVWYGIPASLRFEKKEFKEALSLLGPKHDQLRKRLEAYLKRILLDQEEKNLRESLSRLGPAPDPKHDPRKSFDTYLKQVVLEKAEAKRASAEQKEEESFAGEEGGAGSSLKRILLEQDEKELVESLSRLGPAPEHDQLRKSLDALLKQIVLARDMAKKAAAEQQEPLAVGGVKGGDSNRPGSVSASLPPEEDVTRATVNGQTPPPD